MQEILQSYDIALLTKSQIGLPRRTITIHDIKLFYNFSNMHLHYAVKQAISEIYIMRSSFCRSVYEKKKKQTFPLIPGGQKPEGFEDDPPFENFQKVQYS